MIIGSDKYRFFIATDGVTYVPVKLAKIPQITGSKEDYLYDFRKKSELWKFVRYENASLYDAIVLAISSPSSAISKIKVRIELWDDYVAFTELIFEGYVPLGSFKPDLDSEVMIFTPSEDSIYAWWDEHKSDKKDLLQSGKITNTVKINETSESFDFWLPLSLACASFNNFEIIEHSDGEENGAGIQYWSPDVPYVGIGDGSLEEDKFKFKDAWVLNQRNWKYYHCRQSQPAMNPHLYEPGWGLRWTEYWEVFDWYPYDNAVYHVRQQRSNFHLTGFTRGTGIYQPMFYTETGDTPEATNCPDDKYCKGSASTVTEAAIISTQGNLKLFEVMNYLLAGSGLTFYSQFFSLNTNPVTGVSNRLTNLFFSHKSYIKGKNNADTKGEVSVDDVVNDLCKIFQLAWYVDSINSQFVVEHIVFFENGKKYSGFPVIYADLTNKNSYPKKYQTIEDVKGNPTDGNFDYGGESFQTEVYKLTDTVDADSEIRYDSAFVKVGTKKETSVGELSTDLLNIISNPDDTNDDGYLLLATDSANLVYCRTFTKGMSIRTYINRPNGDLFFDNLIRDFWTYSRNFLSGKINLDQNSTVFITQKRTKKQREVVIPRESGVFNPLGLVRTNHGYGQIESFTYVIERDFIKFILLYTAG